MARAIQWASQNWLFEPARENGEPTAVDVRVTFERVPAGAEAPALVKKEDSPSHAVPFGPGMTAPVRLAGRMPEITEKARSACVSGLLVAKCTIETDGTLSACRVLVGLPFMNAETLDALATWRYTPATFRGNAVAVAYVIPLRFKYGYETSTDSSSSRPSGSPPSKP